MEGFVLIGEVESVRRSSYTTKGGDQVEECVVSVIYRGGTAQTKGDVNDDDYQVGETVALALKVSARKFGDNAGLDVRRLKKLTVPCFTDLGE